MCTTQELFGYTLIEVVGKNVSMLMPEPDSSRHNGYLSNYAQTGRKRVIGTHRVAALAPQRSSRFTHANIVVTLHYA